jgi:hypothetical protein
LKSTLTPYISKRERADPRPDLPEVGRQLPTRFGTVHQQTLEEGFVLCAAVPLGWP